MVGCLAATRSTNWLEAGVFPSPVYCVSNDRPMILWRNESTCLNVRLRNCGVNGKTVIFYAP